MYKQKMKPALAMWTFFSLAVGISLVTFMAEGTHSLLDNILNTTDLFFVISATVVILLFGDKSTRFNRFDTGCLVAVLAIIAFWLVSRHHVFANIAVQSILVIAYFPVIKRMLKSTENTESFDIWIGMFLVAAISLFSAKGILAYVYAIRAVVSTGFLLVLMLRIELKSRKKRTVSPVEMRNAVDAERVEEKEEALLE